MGQYIALGIIALILFIFILIVSLLKRYKRCPSDRVLVVYGKVGKGKSDESRSPSVYTGEPHSFGL